MKGTRQKLSGFYHDACRIFDTKSKLDVALHDFCRLTEIRSIASLNGAQERGQLGTVLWVQSDDADA